jgi:hypothetical protein
MRRPALMTPEARQHAEAHGTVAVVVDNKDFQVRTSIAA